MPAQGTHSDRNEIKSTECLTVTRGSKRAEGLPRKYNTGKQLGKGGFAEVFLCRDTETSEHFAVKVIHKAQITRHRALAKLRSEIEIHRSLSHERVVRFIDHYEDSSNVYILLHFCPNQTLSELIKSRPFRRLSGAEAIFYLYDLVIGLKYLHNRRVIHRDLKLGNLFLDEEARLKIGDFGLAAKLETDRERRKTKCGTPNYIAPEILDDAGHSYEVDIWSLGVIAYTMLCGRPPFEASEVKQIYRRIQNNQYAFPDNVDLPPHSKDVIRSILITNPKKRPSLDEILQMPWFQSTSQPPPLPSNIATSLLTPRRGSSSRCETPEGFRAGNYGRIESPMNRMPLGDRSQASAASPARGSARHWQGSPGLSYTPATPGRGATATIGRPPLAHRVSSDENLPPNANALRCASEDKIIKDVLPATPTGSTTGLTPLRPQSARHMSNQATNSWTGGQTSRNIATQLLGAGRSGAGTPRQENDAGQVTPRRAEGGLCARTPPPRAVAPVNGATPVTGRSRVPSESPSHRGPLMMAGDTPLGSSAALGVNTLAGVLRDGAPGAVVPPDAMPEVWVTKWIDYSSRYGVAYQLHDGSIGVYFNDSTKILSTPDGSRFDYIPRSTAEQPATRTSHNFESYPSDLQKKVTLLRHFRNSISGDSSSRRDGAVAGESTLPMAGQATSETATDVYVRKWSRRGSAVMFSLSNKDIQVVFFDKAEAVLSFRNHMVTYTDKRGARQSFALSQALDAPSPDLARRLRYILSNLLGVASADLPAALR